MNMSAGKPVMPLAHTRVEIDATAAVLRRLASSWDDLTPPVSFDSTLLKHIILVGSGDSWTVALCAAVWLEKRCQLRCTARQTYDFLQIDLTNYQQETLIVVLSASGRPSLAVDALSYALRSGAQVMGISNHPGTPFSAATSNMLFTDAQKQGIPTQSSSATLYALLRLADTFYPGRVNPLKLDASLEAHFAQVRQHWRQKDRRIYQESAITFLGNGLSWGLALSGSNLLSCGPQLAANAFPVEEFHHSLRLNQVHAGQHFILLPATVNEYSFYRSTQAALTEKGATVEWVDFKPEVDETNNLLIVMQWLYEMSWHSGCDFSDAGGQRVSYVER